MNKELDRIKIYINKTVKDAMETINNNGLQAVIVVDKEDHLRGIVTDGDIRRYVMAQKDLEAGVLDVMNPSPIYATNETSESDLRNMMAENVLHMIPVVDCDNRVIRIIHYVDLIRRKKNNTPIILMAGGLGSRLKERTKDCPKPLLKVGRKPILETIIEGFKEQGFQDFYISVNYKAEMIERYFENGERLDVSIRYIREKERLGTAGALSLLPEDIEYPIIVMNGDILTKVNYERMLKKYIDGNVSATVALREYKEEIPYGVVDMDDKTYKIYRIHEKPINRYLVNAGIYVLGKPAKEMIPQGVFYDMPQLIDDLIDNDKTVNGFLVDEYWIDIGVQEELQRAEFEYDLFFG